MNTLPKHLQDTIKKYEDKCKGFGINPNWAADAHKKAVARGDDFNPIHGMVRG